VLDVAGRHPSTAHFAKLFDYEHLTREDMREVSKVCHDTAADLLVLLPDGPELSAGLRKLVEAKDCFVRALL
jgi:hypothetical protein